MIRKGGTAYDTPFAVRAAEGVFCAHKQSQKPCRARSCLHGDAAEHGLMTSNANEECEAIRVCLCRKGSRSDAKTRSCLHGDAAEKIKENKDGQRIGKDL